MDLCVSGLCDGCGIRWAITWSIGQLVGHSFLGSFDGWTVHAVDIGFGAVGGVGTCEAGAGTLLPPRDPPSFFCNTVNSFRCATELARFL